MNKFIIFALSVLVLTGCSIQRWEGKSRDALLSKKGMPDKIEENGEDQIYYYCKHDISESMKFVDRDGNVVANTLADTTYTYEIFAIKKSNTIFFASEEISYIAPKEFSVIEE